MYKLRHLEGKLRLMAQHFRAFRETYEGTLPVKTGERNLPVGIVQK